MKFVSFWESVILLVHKPFFLFKDTIVATPKCTIHVRVHL